MDVRRLRVVEEPDAVDLGDGLAAVGRGLERGEPVTDGLGRDAVGERGRRGGRGVLAMPCAFAVDRAELDRAGGSAGRATCRPRTRRPGPRRPACPRRTNAARRARHARRRGLRVVAVPDVDVVVALVPVDRRLRVTVGLEGAVMVEVVGRQVQQDRDPRVEPLLDRELERRHLDDERLVIAAGRGRERETDVAAGDGVDAGRAQARAEYPRGRRLPVRAGDGEVGRPREARAELELPPDRDLAPSPMRAAAPTAARPGSRRSRRRRPGARGRGRRCAPSPRAARAPTRRRPSRRRDRSVSTTCAPSAARVSAAARPATPAPTTTARSPREARSPETTPRDEVRVEEADPDREHRPAMIQNRTITVNSGQPASSKW